VILHPGVLGLIVGGVLAVGLMITGSVIGLRVLKDWQPSSSSERQLALERTTYLVSALVGLALWIEVGSALLFLHTADDLHELFVGAMCATGALNANPVGWWVLASKASIVLLFPVWIALNHFDQKAGDFPLVRLKYALLLVLTPIAATDLVLLLRYFLGIHPDIITSCCGSLFSESGDSVAGELASLPAAVAVPVFFVTSGVFLAALTWALRSRRPASMTALAATTPVVLVVGIASVISFVSVAYYELPTHHCPFDLFQGASWYVGYPLAAGLLTAVVSAALPGVLHPLVRKTSARGLKTRAETTWLISSLAAYIVFLVVAVWPLVFGNLAWELL
jgi:hypothetical protein